LTLCTAYMFALSPAPCEIEFILFFCPFIINPGAASD
jgi:hypothetical protein